MKNPLTETDDLELDIETVVTRYDTSLTESNTESSVQVIFQWGSYMGLIYLIDKIMNARHKDVNLVCSDEQEGFQATICHLNQMVAFRIKILLWFSSLGSILSLAFSQQKDHNVQHEFSTTWQMKTLYICAALMNTVSYITLLISCFTTTLDFNN